MKRDDIERLTEVFTQSLITGQSDSRINVDRIAETAVNLAEALGRQFTAREEAEKAVLEKFRKEKEALEARKIAEAKAETEKAKAQVIAAPQPASQPAKAKKEHRKAKAKRAVVPA